MKHKEKNAVELTVNQARIEFTKKALTAWGGICTVLAKYVESIGLQEWVEATIPIVETSPNAKGIYPKLLSHFLTVLCGGRRFSHIQWWSHGTEALCTAFGLDWLPSAPSVFTRFWDKFNTQSLCDRWNQGLRSLCYRG